MDAETWMDANKAVELGFADETMQRSEVAEDMDTPVSMLFYCFKHSLWKEKGYVIIRKIGEELVCI